MGLCCHSYCHYHSHCHCHLNVYCPNATSLGRNPANFKIQMPLHHPTLPHSHTKVSKVIPPLPSPIETHKNLAHRRPIQVGNTQVMYRRGGETTLNSGLGRNPRFSTVCHFSQLSLGNKQIHSKRKLTADFESTTFGTHYFNVSELRALYSRFCMPCCFAKRTRLSFISG